MQQAKLTDFRVPSMPQAAREALVYFYKDDPDIRMLAKSIGKDVGLVSSVVKLANSAYFSGGTTTSDLQVAINRIGLNALRQILMTNSLAKSFQFNPICQLDGRSFWQHCAFVGQLAFEIARKHAPEFAADLQLAGLMHDVGIAGLATLEPEFLATLVQESRTSAQEFASVERRLGWESHCLLSERVLQDWNMPENVQILVKWHDTRERAARGNLPGTTQRLIDILILSDTLAHRFGAGFPNYQRDTRIDPGLMSNLQLSSDYLLEAVKVTKHYLQMFV